VPNGWTALQQGRVHKCRDIDAHLRLPRLDGGARPAQSEGRTAHLRPLRAALRATVGPAGVAGHPSCSFGGMSAPATPIDLSPFIKAYDVRGLVGSQLTDEVVEALGAAFVDEVDAAGGDVIVGHDMRDSSPGFAAAFAAVSSARGCHDHMIGLSPTEPPP